MSDGGRVDSGEISGSSPSTALEVAAELIHTLDNAFSEMSSFATSAAVNAEDARRNAHAAGEFAKLYTSKDYRNHSSSGSGDSFEATYTSSNTNSHSNYADALTAGMLPIDHELSSSGFDDSTTTIETLSHFQNETYHEDGCNWKENGRAEEAGEHETIRSVSERKHGHTQYQKGTVKMDDEIAWLVKKGKSISEHRLEVEPGVAQCQNENGTGEMDECHEERGIDEVCYYSTNENGPKEEHGDDKYQNDSIKVNECHKGEGIDKVGYYSKSENGLERKYGDSGKKSCSFDHIYNSPVEIRPLVDILPSASKHLTPKDRSTSLTDTLCQDHSDASPATDIEYTDIVYNCNDQQQENSLSHPPSSTISSRLKSLSPSSNGQIDWKDTSPTFIKSEHVRNEAILRGKQEHVPGCYPSPLTVKSFEDKELTRFSTGRLSSAEISHSHAEDVLSMSLDLERMKIKLKTEAESSSETRRAFDKEKKKTSWLTAEIRRKNNELEKLKANLSQTQYRVKAAEEDAEKALKIAKRGASSQQEIEDLLNNALNEIEHLRRSAAHNTHDHKTINDEEKLNHGTRLPVITEEVIVLKHKGQSNHCTAIIASPSLEKDTSRAIISVGRSLLRRATSTNADDSSSKCALQGGSPNSNGSHWIDLKRKTAEKRRRLRERMKHSNTGEHPVTETEIVCYSSKRAPSDKARSANLTFRNVAMIVRKSGKSLNLDGRWFSIRRGRRRDEDEMELEPMTVQYCKSVEVIISRHQKEVRELEAFNTYLEGHIANS